MTANVYQQSSVRKFRRILYIAVITRNNFPFFIQAEKLPKSFDRVKASGHIAEFNRQYILRKHYKIIFFAALFVLTENYFCAVYFIGKLHVDVNARFYHTDKPFRLNFKLFVAKDKTISVYFKTSANFFKFFRLWNDIHIFLFISVNLYKYA